MSGQFVSKQQMDRATWPAVVRAYRIAEEALALLSTRDVVQRQRVAKEALEAMRAEVEACQG